MEPIRGRGLETRAFGPERVIEYEARQVVEFTCGKCATVRAVTFAAAAEIPDQWECSRCGNDATRAGVDKPILIDSERVTGKTPFEMLLERRSREELEEILSDRLSYYRARRGDETSGAA